MAGWNDIGVGLAIIAMTVNLFLTAFSGIPVSTAFQKFINVDQNITAASFNNNQYQIGSSSYSTPTTSTLTNPNDPFGDIVASIAQDAYGFFLGLAAGITIYAFAFGVPSAIILAVIAPINLIMIFYVITFIAETTSGFLKGVLGG